MSQEFQRRHGNARPEDVDQSLLVEALSNALVKATQNQQDAYRLDPDDDDDAGMSVDLLEMFFYVLGKVHWVILAAVLGALLAGLYAFYLVVPQYQATAKLYILNQTGLSVSVSDLQVAANLTLDYQEVFKTWEVHEMVRSDLNLDYSYTEMQQMLSVTNPNDTRLLYISAKHSDPQMAMEIANAYARAAKTFIYQVMEGDEPNEFSIALVPSEAIGMGRVRYVLLGFIGGAALVVAGLVIMFLLDDRPHTPDDITKMAGIPTLAVVPREQKLAKARKRRVQQPRREGKR